MILQSIGQVAPLHHAFRPALGTMPEVATGRRSTLDKITYIQMPTTSRLQACVVW